MFKKVIYISFIILALSFNLSFSQEKIGQVVGKYEKTNEKVSLNGVFVDLYKLNGKDAVLIEELIYCGYDMNWDPKSRTTTFKDNNKQINKNMNSSMNKNMKGNIYSSDVKVYMQDNSKGSDKIQINAYNIGGYSLVYLEDLKNVSGYTGYINSIKLKDISGNICLPNKEKAPKGGIDVNIQTYHCFTPYVGVVDEVKVHLKEGENSAKYNLKGNKDGENIIYFFVMDTDKYYNSSDEQLHHNRTYEIAQDFNAISIGDKVKQDVLISRNSKIKGVINFPENVDNKSLITTIDTREIKVRAFYENKSNDMTLKKSLDDKNISFELNVPKDFNNGKFSLGVQATMYEGFSRRHYMGGPIMLGAYYKDGKLINDIEKAQVLSAKLDNINLNIDIDKSIGKDIGKVYILKGKFKDKQIDVFNIDGHLGVKASHLNDLGYEINFDNMNKRLDIKSNKSNNTLNEMLKIKDSELTMTWAKYTDINTYLDNKKITGFNVDSSMVVFLDNLKIKVDLNEHIVSFDDINLEKAIREVIDKPSGDIYLSDLNRDYLRYLNLSSKDITSLNGIEKISSIRTLKLNDNNIQDISCLSKLKELYSIDLNNNKIENIDSLQKLSDLSNVKLSGNNISDISALQSLSELSSVDLSNNNIEDISPLKNLKSLNRLDLACNNINDISDIKNLTNLYELTLNKNKINNIDSLSNIQYLYKLYLSENNIKDYSPINSYYNKLKEKDF
ncbi:leucine-rich repeat domain-containing protein [Tepidibacter mesophilus]|uniref:leucine-rich repeat domain-containing protein n=1 Tax=Tepidibacter mesophilus TaxID=655607 RepID=UPI000C072840|nr:leucine-rich repeat domain-containing protein [Tepidibacter mesophilus]